MLIMAISADSTKALIVAYIATTSGIEVITGNGDDFHDKFPSDLTVGEGQPTMLHILLEAQAVCGSKNFIKGFFPGIYYIFLYFIFVVVVPIVVFYHNFVTDILKGGVKTKCGIFHTRGE
jgi:hypothetical protein